MKKGAVFNDAFLVCHEIYAAARELVNSRVPTTQLQSASKFLWRPDLRPRLVDYVADFARAGERALGEGEKPAPLKTKGAAPTPEAPFTGDVPAPDNPQTLLGLRDWGAAHDNTITPCQEHRG